MPLVFKYDDFLMPSLSAQAAALYNESAVEPVLLQTAGFTESDHLQGVNLGGFETVPTDREGRMLIRYYTTPQEVFPPIQSPAFSMVPSTPASMRVRLYWLE